MGYIEWAIWANEQAMISSLMIILGGIVGCYIYVHNSFPFAVYSLIFGALVFIFEYPRSKRKKGAIRERRFQKFIAPVIGKCGIVSRNYFVRFVLYVILPVPCYFSLPTLMGGMCLFIASIIYLKAAIKGEEWKMPIDTPMEVSEEALSSPNNTMQTSVVSSEH